MALVPKEEFLLDKKSAQRVVPVLATITGQKVRHETWTAESDIHGLGIRKRKGAPRAGDLRSGLPLAMRAESTMCYIGREGTSALALKKMCASLVQNGMIEVSGMGEGDGKVSYLCIARRWGSSQDSHLARTWT